MTDAVVLGGGPAGASAARLLAAWGRDVLLLTRPNPAGALAESLPPSCSRLFDRIGVSAAIDAASFVRSSGNTVRWGARAERIESFADSARGWQVERAAFDGILLDRARAAGARIVTSATVREVAADALRAGERKTARAAAGDGASPRVRYELGPATHEEHARWVLDCTGRAGIVARRGWRRPDPGGRTLGLVAYFDRPGGWDVPDPTHTLVESWDAGWAWSVPVSTTRRCVAVMLDPMITRLPGRARLNALYRGELARAKWLSGLAADASPASEVRAFDATPYGAHRVSAEGVLLVGDAASFIDPLSSFGVKKAMASGWLAAVVVHSALDQPSISREARALYAARERAMHAMLARRHTELARDTAAGHDEGFWSERAAGWSEGSAAEPDVAALRTDPDILRAFESLRERPSIRLRADDRVRRASRPVVRGNRIAMAEHLVSPAFPDGIRWIRDVDLVRLAELAPDHDQVPDLFEAYIRGAPPVPLPDFLGALALLLGKGMLRHA